MSSTTPKYQIPSSFNLFDMSSNTNTEGSYSVITARSYNGVPISSYGWRLPIPNLLNYESDYDWSDVPRDVALYVASRGQASQADAGVPQCIEEGR